MFKDSINRPVQDELFMTAPNLGSSPGLLFSILRETMDDSAPHYIQPIIEQGIADGSIAAEYPLELAELIMLVGNFWMNPMVFDDSEEKIFHKAMIFRQMMRGLGLDVIDDELVNRFRELAAIYQKNR